MFNKQNHSIPILFSIATIVLFLGVLIGTSIEVKETNDNAAETVAAETENKADTETQTVSYGINHYRDNIYLRTYGGWRHSGQMLNEIAGLIIEQHEEDCQLLCP